MLQQDAMWEMNRAHRQDLMDAAARHRLLSQGRKWCPALLDSFMALVGQSRSVLARDVWTDGRWTDRAVMR
jgi:hypothetical protein